MGGEGKALENFYKELFDWNISSDNEWNYGVVQTGNENGINGGVGPEGPGPRRVCVYASVSDINDTLDVVKKLGGTVVMERTEIPGQVTMALFTDPAGNVTGLVEDYQ